MEGIQENSLSHCYKILVGLILNKYFFVMLTGLCRHDCQFYMSNQHYQTILLLANKLTSSETMFSLISLLQPSLTSLLATTSPIIEKITISGYMLPHTTTVSQHWFELSLLGYEDQQTLSLLSHRQHADCGSQPLLKNP